MVSDKWWVVVVTRSRGDAERRFGPFPTYDAAVRARRNPDGEIIRLLGEHPKAWAYSLREVP